MKPRAVLSSPTADIEATNRVSALLGTGTLRALDARVELAGQNPGLVADSWLRAQRLITAGVTCVE